jgi:ankyrin repeat protein
VLLAAGADPNVKGPDGSTPLHQAVQARQVPIIRALAAAGADLDATNGDHLTPLQLAEKPEPPRPAGNNTDPRVYRRQQDTREDVIAALRELMGLGPDDPTPVPPPAVEEPADDDGIDAGSDAPDGADVQGAAQ